MRKKRTQPVDGNTDVYWYKRFRLDTVFKQRYGPKEVTTVRKVMIPVSLIIKLWKRVFR